MLLTAEASSSACLVRRYASRPGEEAERRWDHDVVSLSCGILVLPWMYIYLHGEVDEANAREDHPHNYEWHSITIQERART